MAWGDGVIDWLAEKTAPINRLFMGQSTGGHTVSPTQVRAQDPRTPLKKTFPFIDADGDGVPDYIDRDGGRGTGLAWNESPAPPPPDPMAGLLQGQIGELDSIVDRLLGINTQGTNPGAAAREAGAAFRPAIQGVKDAKKQAIARNKADDKWIKRSYAAVEADTKAQAKAVAKQTTKEIEKSNKEAMRGVSKMSEDYTREAAAQIAEQEKLGIDGSAQAATRARLAEQAIESEGLMNAQQDIHEDAMQLQGNTTRDFLRSMAATATSEGLEQRALFRRNLQDNLGQLDREIAGLRSQQAQARLQAKTQATQANTQTQLAVAGQLQSLSKQRFDMTMSILEMSAQEQGVQYTNLMDTANQLALTALGGDHVRTAKLQEIWAELDWDKPVNEQSAEFVRKAKDAGVPTEVANTWYFTTRGEGGIR